MQKTNESFKTFGKEKLIELYEQGIVEKTTSLVIGTDILPEGSADMTNPMDPELPYRWTMCNIKSVNENDVLIDAVGLDEITLPADAKLRLVSRQDVSSLSMTLAKGTILMSKKMAEVAKDLFGELSMFPRQKLDS